MPATVSKTKYPCARCGRKHTADRMVRSRFTGNRYCRRCTSKGGRS